MTLAHMIFPSAEVYDHMGSHRRRPSFSREPIYEHVKLRTLLADLSEDLWPCTIEYYVTTKPVSLVTEHVVTNVVVTCDGHDYSDFEGQVNDHIKAEYKHVEIEGPIERKSFTI